MGNQHGNPRNPSGVVIEEALESMKKEKQRYEHLKNLEFKRTKYEQLIQFCITLNNQSREIGLL